MERVGNIRNTFKCLACEDETELKCKYCLKLLCQKHLSYCCLAKGIFIADKKQLKTAKEDLGFSLEKHDRSCISALVISNKNDCCFSGGDDWSVRLWDFPSLIQKGIVYNHDAAVTCLCISNNDRILISGSSDCSIKLQKLNQKSTPITLHGHKGKIISIQLIKNNEFCVSGSSDKSCRIWNIKEKTQVSKIKQKFFTKFLRVLKNAEFLLFCTNTNTIIIWELNNNKALFELEQGQNNDCPLTCTNENTLYLAIGLENGIINVWDLNSWNLYNTYLEHKTSIQALALTNNNKFLFSSDKMNAIIKWDLASAAPFEFFTIGETVFNTLALDPTDLFLISSDLNRDIKIWKISEKNSIKTSSGHKSFVYCCWICKNSAHIVSVDDENMLAYWDITEKTIKFSTQIPSKIKYLTCSPVNCLISFLCCNNFIYILNPSKPSTIQKFSPVFPTPKILKFTKSEKYLIVLITANNNKILQIIKIQTNHS